MKVSAPKYETRSKKTANQAFAVFLAVAALAGCGKTNEQGQDYPSEGATAENTYQPNKPQPAETVATAEQPLPESGAEQQHLQDVDLQQLSEDELAEALNNTSTVAVESTTDSTEQFNASASSVEVAVAFAKAFAEADAQTICELRVEDCDPTELADLPLIPDFAPTGAKELVNNPSSSIVEVFKEYGHWCIELVKYDEGWKVDRYTTPPPSVKC